MTMNLASKTVLVTGSDGFIGSHLVEELLEKGCKVRAFVYYNSFGSWGWLDRLDKEKLSQIEVVSELPTALQDQEHLGRKLQAGQQKLLSLVEYVRHEGDRQAFLHDYFANLALCPDILQG